MNDVVHKIQESKTLASSEWKSSVKTSSDGDIERFYSSSQYYIYEIMRSYLWSEMFNKGINYSKIIRILQKLHGGKVLEFGGGSGQLCLMVYFNTANEVAYADLPGRIFQFAK